MPNRFPQTAEEERRRAFTLGSFPVSRSWCYPSAEGDGLKGVMVTLLPFGGILNILSLSVKGFLSESQHTFIRKAAACYTSLQTKRLHIKCALE